MANLPAHAIVGWPFAPIPPSLTRMSDTAPTIPLLPAQRSFWQRIADRVRAFLGAPNPALPPQRSVAFTIAVIALGAKLAKADGHVHKSEVAAFRRIFVIPRDDERAAARVFDLARQTVAGYEEWASRLARLFPPGDPILVDVVEGLYIIASADGAIQQAERDFLETVARIFGLGAAALDGIRRRHDPARRCIPCEVLGITPDTPLAEARARWHELVREAHPDRAIARGLPPEAVRLAGSRTRQLNEAWHAFRDSHARTRDPDTENRCMA